MSRRVVLAAGTTAALAGCGRGADPQAEPTAPAAQAPQASPYPTQEPTTRWRARRIAPAEQLSAYADDSVTAGEPLKLRVSATDPWRASVYRLGYFRGKGGTQVAQVAGPARAFAQTRADPATLAVSAGWPVVAELPTAGWPSGLYMLVVRTAAGGTHWPFVVRPVSVAGKVVVVAASMTWQAYNIWGGRSLYKDSAGSFAGRSYAVSCDRPYDHGLWGAPIAMGFDVPVARFADEVGIDHVWVTNADVSRVPGLLAGAKAVVSTGHDEYWTAAYRDALIGARDAGAPLAFLGANAGYWRVGLRGDEVRCAKDASLQPRNIRWRDQGKPESAVVGMLYDAFPVDGPLVVRNPDFALFDGVGTAGGRQYPGLIGIETDRWYPGFDTPRDIEVPALSPVTCRGAGTWSTMTYYSVASGASVFATGTMNWTRALTGPSRAKGITGESSEFARAVTANLLEGMADGTLPAARRDVPDLPDYNTSGAA